MNYYFDTEFIEGKQPVKFLGIKISETKPIVDLISIGVVCEDNREYYAISNEFNVSHAWSDDWIRKNVLLEIYTSHINGDERNRVDFSLRSMKGLIKSIGKPNKLIATEILMFIADPGNEIFDEWIGGTDEYINLIQQQDVNPTFWAYFASTDWVAFYQLWGKMIDAPICYPFFAMDLKNLMEFRGLDKEWKRKNAPDPDGEHNALVDARWNKGLHSKIIETTMVNND